ncbi:MAG TPA: helix-turn-helix domain-containing protein [Chloroflexota bacterium]|nr:helix-turn-helix domain-containing protein [Chloroflexota bacterium]
MNSAPVPRPPLAARTAEDPASGETWLPIRRAAEILGVSVATLRLWTAAGKLSASVTPGGHRRYAEAEVRRLLAERPDPAWETAASELVATLRTRYAQLARDEVRRQAWFSSFDDAARGRVHALGEELLAQVAQFLLAPGARERTALLRGGRRIGARYGDEVARLGLTASEALEAFLFFRRPILDSVSAMARAHPGLALPAGEALAALTRFMDVVLLAMTRTYERGAAARRGGP